MTLFSRRLLHVGALTLAAMALGVIPSYGQSSSSATPPPTQDDTVRFQLGIGNAAGCLPLLGIAANDPNALSNPDSLSTTWAISCSSISDAIIGRRQCCCQCHSLPL